MFGITQDDLAAAGPGQCCIAAKRRKPIENDNFVVLIEI
jgi:hypothetical protein